MEDSLTKVARQFEKLETMIMELKTRVDDLVEKMVVVWGDRPPEKPKAIPMLRRMAEAKEAWPVDRFLRVCPYCRRSGGLETCVELWYCNSCRHGGDVLAAVSQFGDINTKLTYLQDLPGGKNGQREAGDTSPVG